VYSQGTYTTSVKPPLFFSNTFVGHMGPSDMKRKLWKGDPNWMYNCAEYRSEDPPGFKEKPYIFTSIGRTQNCKSHIFTGEPEIITGNLDEALQHFQTTDFKEFTDVVKNYALKVKESTPDIKPDEGCRFFY